MGNRRQKLHIAAAALLLLLLCGCGASRKVAAAEAAVTPAPVTIPAVTPAPTPAPAQLTIADQADHPALMANDGSGAFYPERTVRRGELCRMLCALLEGLPEGQPVFSDYYPGNTGYDAAAALYAAGLLPEREGEAFRPEEAATRGELAQLLNRLAGRLPPEEGSRTLTLAEDVAAGTLSRSGTSAGEDEPLRREELAVILVTLAGREPAETALFLAECLPEDIDRDSFAWACIADAVTEGPVPPPAPGLHRVYGGLYAVWEDGTLVTDMDYGVWTFGPDGRYTTGDEELDGYLARALEESGASELTGEEALQAVYLYVKYYGEYLVRPEDMETPDVGDVGWGYRRALDFFRNGGGTCYGFSAAFGLLARSLGETAYIVSATINQYNGPHAFVVIPEDGVDWIYDVELEATRQYRHSDLELFHIQNYTIYFYWYEPYWE